MAKLRRIAMQVPDLENAAAFCETAFGLRRVCRSESEIGDTVMLSDGVVVDIAEHDRHLDERP